MGIEPTSEAWEAKLTKSNTLERRHLAILSES
jgi:hypothetical protein